MRPPVDLPALYADAKGGKRAAVARLLSVIERGGDAARELGRLTFADAGHGYTVGLTGAPGAGKSTLTAALVARMRQDDLCIGVLAIDPSSPFTGGAILGDRVRMQDHALDESVFIRSMATRGHLGGLALATPEAVRLLEATGRSYVLIETVGVGQVEVEIAGAADTTVVVVNPGWGDAVQANKAGLMEVADVFVINKGDRAGTEDTRRDLEYMLDLSAKEGWRPPVVVTVATDGKGLDELWAAIGAHRAEITASGELEARRRQRSNDELSAILRSGSNSRYVISRLVTSSPAYEMPWLIDRSHRGTRPVGSSEPTDHTARSIRQRRVISLA
ncbi:MAG: methylmalonyl Co-A mutase-associated GTPase MeaB [Acidimicrobiales bacterium]